MFLDAFVAVKLIFNTFYEIYQGNYAFTQNYESLAAHKKSSAAHRLRNIDVLNTSFNGVRQQGFKKTAAYTHSKKENPSWTNDAISI